MDIIVEVELDGYKCELALTRHQFDTARLSKVSNSKKAAQIDHYQKMISIAARRRLVAEGRADTWVDYYKLKLEIVREVDQPPLIQKKGDKAKIESSSPQALSLFDEVPTQSVKPDPYCGCTG